jgi:hypothetical protein
MSSPTSRRSGPSQAPGFAGPENSGAFRTIEINLEATWVKLGVGSWSFPKGDSNQRKVTTSPTDNSKASVPMSVGRMSLTGFEGKHFVMAGRTRIQTATKSIEVITKIIMKKPRAILKKLRIDLDERRAQIFLAMDIKRNLGLDAEIRQVEKAMTEIEKWLTSR